MPLLATATKNKQRLYIGHSFLTTLLFLLIPDDVGITFGRGRHINKTRTQDIISVYQYWEKCNKPINRKNHRFLNIHGKTAKQLENITTDIFKVSGKTVSRIVTMTDADGLHHIIIYIINEKHS